MQKALKIGVVAIRIALGLLFVYAGIQKFIPKERPPAKPGVELPVHVQQMKAYIGGLKQTGYFWPMLGVVEIAAGIMLLSQVLALLGAFVLLPVSLNIFLFHACLEPHDTNELLLTGLYLLANLLLILREYPTLKPVFFHFNFSNS